MVYTESPISVETLFSGPTDTIYLNGQILDVAKIHNATPERSTENPVTKLWLNYDPNIYPKTIKPQFMERVLWGAPLKETLRYIDEIMEGQGVVLDEGAGVGLNSLKVLQQFPDIKVILSDVSFDFLEVANIELSKAGFLGRYALIEYDALYPPLPISSESVDLIMHNQFTQFFTPEGRLLIAKENYRLLRPGGSIIDGTFDIPGYPFEELFKNIATDPNEDPEAIRDFLEIRPKVQQFDALSRQGWMRLASQQEIFNTAALVGFTDCRILMELRRDQLDSKENQRPGAVYEWVK